jgi:hypothetical protein
MELETNSLQIKELKIKLYTNLPNKELKIVDFNLNMLYAEEFDKEIDLKNPNFNQLPYFTSYVKYPYDLLIKNLKTYKERVEFFFDINKFQKTLVLFSKNIKQSIDEKKINKIAENNVMIMIELLFPTKFTIINNYNTSYDYLLDNSSLKRMIFNPFTNKSYSYLKLANNKIYTFTRLIWLNDILNHPLYRKFMNEFNTFLLWYKKEENKIKKERDEIMNELSKTANVILKDIILRIKLSLDKPILSNKITGDAKKLIEFLLKLSYLININYNTKELLKIFDKKNDLYNDILYLLNSEYVIDDNVDEFINKKNNKDLIDEFINKKKELTQEKIQIDPKIINNLKKINTKLFDINSGKLENFKKYIKKPLKELENDSSIKLSPEYLTFMRIVRSQYRETIRTTNNDYLQSLIDGNDQATIQQFFDIFEKIYNKYMLGIKEKLDINEQEKEEDIMQKVLNTSINKVNTNTQNWTYEIYIMVDFIEGKVNDKNANEIFCPYVGEYLGTMSELLFQLQLYGKTNENDIYRWAVDRNRTFFSIKDMKINSGENTKQLMQKAVKNGFLKENNNKNNTKSTIELERINSLFINNIVSSNKEILDIIDKLQKNSIIINESIILSYIEKNNKKLYNAIINSFNDENVGNQELLKELISLRFNYESEKTNLENTLLLQKNIIETKLLEINKNIENYNLYIKILETLIVLEKKKQFNVNIGGRTQKKVHFKNKTIKNYKNIYYR